MTEQRGRTLTDSDIDSIVKGLEKVFWNRFFGDLGRGVWSLAWKGIVLVILVIAAYGAHK